MARLKVPERYFEGIAKILSLQEETFRELIEALVKLPIKLHPKDFMLKAISGVHNISPDKVGIIADALLSLCINRAGSDKSNVDCVDEVIQSIEESGSEKLKLSRESKEVLKNRLSKILDVQPLAVSTKATSILFEQDRTFTRARILTDIRPVFSAKADNPPDTAVIVHALNIHYHRNGDHKEFFVSMDDEDVQMLLDVLARAKVKAKSLKQVLTSAKITCVDKS